MKVIIVEWNFSGQAEKICGSWIKPGAVVIDCGINAIDDSTKKAGKILYIYIIPIDKDCWDRKNDQPNGLIWADDIAWHLDDLAAQRARKFKNVQAEKLVKSNKSKNFFVKLHFWQF